MQVKGFMIPSEKVATCEPGDSIKYAVDTMVAKKIGAIVVLDGSVDSINPRKPVGIVTKSDLLASYQKGITLDHPVSEVMSPEVQTVRDDQSRDQAARAFEFNKTHHAVVVNSEGKFVGLITTFDLATECVKDDRAWPWIRSEDGRFHKPSGDAAPSSPRSTAAPADNLKASHAYLDYIDSVRNLQYMDD